MTTISESLSVFKVNKGDDYKEQLLNSFDSLRKELKASPKCPFNPCSNTFSSAYDLATHVSTTHRPQIQHILQQESTGALLPYPKSKEERLRLERLLGFWSLTSLREVSNNSKPQSPVVQTLEPTTKPNSLGSVSFLEDFIKRKGPSDFSRLSDMIRSSDSIATQWKGKVWNYYHKKHNGLVKCYGCHEAEATQIHHSSQPFHEIILRVLRESNTTAELIINQYRENNSKPFDLLLKKITTIHKNLYMEDCIPFCDVCNQTVEVRRKKLTNVKNQLDGDKIK